jgi:phage regulator Rha-like protein
MHLSMELFCVETILGFYTFKKHAEWNRIQTQVFSNQDDYKESPINMRSHNVTAFQIKRNNTTPPYDFTEQGVAMLSGILNSDMAINMNIAIMRAFVEIRKIVLMQNDLKQQLNEIRETLGEHDAQLNQIYDAMENLLDEKAAHRKFEERKKNWILV